jgi:hypothetical protein
MLNQAMELNQTEQAFIDGLRRKGFVVCAWVPAEVQELRPSWSLEKVVEEMALIAGTFSERAQEIGWEELDEMLTPEARF